MNLHANLAEWQTADELVVLELGEGQDSEVMSWQKLLAQGERQGRVDYTVCQHQIDQGDADNKPVASNGDPHTS